MSGLHNVPPGARLCPFCGVATDVAHETQEGCIAALHAEISRMRDIIATLRPAGVPGTEGDREEAPAPARLELSEGDTR